MKTRSLNCPGCGGKHTVLVKTKIFDDRTIITVEKCSDCEEVPELADFDLSFKEEGKQQSYYLD